MKKIKFNKQIKNAINVICSYLNLPHIWILFLIVILSIVAFILALFYNTRNDFLSSLFLSLFTGFFTGVVICLLSTVKSIWLYKTESIIKWIENTNLEYLEFKKKYHELFFGKKQFDDKYFYDEMYDLLCLGNNVSVNISQGRFNKALPFDSYAYCIKHFNFDAQEVMESNESIRDTIIYRFCELSPREINDLFRTMDKPLSSLNYELLKEKDNLLIKVKYLNTSFL